MNAYVNWKKKLSELDSEPNPSTTKKAIEIASEFIKNKNEITNNLNHGCGFHTLHNIPIDDIIPAPPINGLRPYNKDYISEYALLGITGLLGYSVFSYKQEKDGCFVHEITPTPGNESKKSSNGVVGFSFHTDAAYLPRESRPETLTLLCLKNEANTGTQIASLDKILKNLSPSCINELKLDNFLIKSPDSFELEQSTHTSILKEYNGKMEIQLSIEVTTPLTQKASNAIIELSEVANEQAETLMWKPGDLLIFNNRRTLHGRKEIRGSRWLQRCYGSTKFKSFTVIDLR